MWVRDRWFSVSHNICASEQWPLSIWRNHWIVFWCFLCTLWRCCLEENVSKISAMSFISATVVLVEKEVGRLGFKFTVAISYDWSVFFKLITGELEMGMWTHRMCALLCLQTKLVINVLMCSAKQNFLYYIFSLYIILWHNGIAFDGCRFWAY